MDMSPTPKIAFLGGPLDGQVIAKNRPGRWPIGIGADGVAMRTDNFYKACAQANQPDLYRFSARAFDEGSEIGTYEWQGSK
jgi:hypothetical protein